MAIVFYSLIYLAVLCYKITVYALATGEYCSGTGRGSTRFFRLCNEMSLVIPLAFDFVLLIGLAICFQARRPNPIIKRIAFGTYIAYILVSPFMWNLPFFLNPTR